MKRWLAPLVVVGLSLVAALAWMFWPSTPDATPTVSPPVAAVVRRGPEAPVVDRPALPQVAVDTGPGTSGLHGEVVDGAGRPIVQVRVLYRAHTEGDQRPGDVLTAASNGEGRFDLPAKGPFRWDVSLSAPDHEDLHQLIESNDGGWVSQRFVLLGGSTLAGQVADQAGKPVFGATFSVHRCRAGPETCFDHSVAVSGDDGHFETRELEPGNIDLVVVKEGKQTWRKTVPVPGPPLNVVLLDRPTAAGTVVAENGAAVPNAQLLIEGPLGETPVKAGRDKADATGNFKAPVEAPGRYRLSALGADSAGRSTGVGMLEVDVGAAGISGLTLRLEAGLSIRGVAKSATGILVGGAAVFVARPGDPNPVAQRQRIDQGAEPFRGRTVTAQDGSFELKGLAAGEYQLWATIEEGSSPSVTVAAGATGVQLVLEAGRH